MQNTETKASPEFVQALTECAKAAVEVGKMEQERTEEAAKVINYQTKVWLPKAKKSLIIDFFIGMGIWIIITAILHLTVGEQITNYLINHTATDPESAKYYYMLLGSLGFSIILPFVLIKMILSFAKQKRNNTHDRRVIELEKQISASVKQKWIPNKKIVDKLISKDSSVFYEYEKEINNLSEINSYMRSLTVAKRVGKAMGKQLLPSKGQLAAAGIICVGLLGLAGVIIGSSSGMRDFGNYSDK